MHDETAESGRRQEGDLFNVTPIKFINVFQIECEK